LEDEVVIPDVPSYPEFSVPRMWPWAEAHPLFINYVPDEYFRANAKVDSRFFWCVFYKLNQGLVEALVADVTEQRKEAKAPPEEKEYLTPTPLLTRMMTTFPQKPGKYPVPYIFDHSLCSQSKQRRQRHVLGQSCSRRTSKASSRVKSGGACSALSTKDQCCRLPFHL
jgi:hypothetical protein